MAKTESNAEFIEDGGPILDGPQYAEDAIAEEFNSSEEQDKWKIIVTRWTGKIDDQPEVFRCTPDDFPIIDRLRNECGAGKYRATIWKNSRLYRRIQYQIEIPQGAAAPAAVKSELGSLAQVLSDSMKEQRAFMERFMDKLSAGGGKGFSDKVTETMLLALIEKAFNPPAREPESSLADKAFEFVKLGMEAADRFAQNGGGGPTSWLDLARDALKTIGPALSNLDMSQLRLAPPQQPAPQGITQGPRVEPSREMNGASEAATARPTNGAVKTQDQNAAEFARYWKMQLDYLVTRAKIYLSSKRQLGDPRYYADWVLDNIDEPVLRPLMAQPNTLEILISICPDVAPYGEWFQTLIVEVRAALAEIEHERLDDEVAHVETRDTVGQQGEHVPGPTDSNVDGAT